MNENLPYKTRGHYMADLILCSKYLQEKTNAEKEELISSKWKYRLLYQKMVRS